MRYPFPLIPRLPRPPGGEERGTFAEWAEATNLSFEQDDSETHDPIPEPPPAPPPPPPLPHPPVAKFIVDDRNGQVPFLATFTDQSTGTPTGWLWDFGDGNTSTDQNPSNTYIDPGVYTVTLTVTNEGGSSTKIKPDFIEATAGVPPPPPPDPPEASFFGNPTSGQVPLVVQFTDTSTGDPTSWAWDFGDGQISALQNPAHTYTGTGTFDVTLTVTNDDGEDTLTIPDYITTGVPPPPPPPPDPDFAIGTWGVFNSGRLLDPLIIANKGIIGLGIDIAWSVVNPSQNVYVWTRLDSQIEQAAAAGFKVALAINAGFADTPQWVIDATSGANKIDFIDSNEDHAEFCNLVPTCLPWSDPFRQARLDLIAAAGAKYSNHPAVEGWIISYLNHHSHDWNIQDLVIVDLQCPACPQPPPRQCGLQSQDQPALWVAAGWTDALALSMGEEIFDACAEAFPTQKLRLPIGGMRDTRMSPDYTSLVRSVQDYVFGSPDTGNTGQSYANRFFLERQIFNNGWADGTFYLENPPGTNGDNYLKYMIAYRARPDGPFPGHASVQPGHAATLGPPQCLMQGGPTGSCGSSCPPACVMAAAYEKIATYNLDQFEIVVGDCRNPDLYNVIRDGTIGMGGTPRP